jgi:hypothetical protein
MKNKILEVVLTVLMAAYNLMVLIFSMLWIFSNSFSSWKSRLGQINAFDVNENVTYGLFLSGALGGSFYCLRAIYQRLAETFTPADGEPAKSPMNMKVWSFWYLYRPIEGGVLALILLVLTKSNLLQLQNSSEVDVSSYYTLIGLGFLAGFGAHELIHKILEIIHVIFAKSKIRATDTVEKAKENRGEL